MTRVFREEYQHPQLVNRSDDVVPYVFIQGQVAWRGAEFTPELGQVKMGQLLRPRHSVQEPVQDSGRVKAA